VEAVVWLLTRELARLGHQVTVFACDGSQVDGELVTTLPGPYDCAGSPGDWELCEWVNLCRAIEESGRFDVIHSHAYLWGLPLEPLTATPMVHTMHVWPYADSAALWRRRPEAVVTALSRCQWAEFADLEPAAVVANGVDTDDFTFNADPDEYLCWLGRFLPGKGPLEAIAAARSCGRRLVLAGPANDYLREAVLPLVDGEEVCYAGELSAGERDKLLGGAAALVYPVRAAEPFGMVLAEAMMCGTPVAAIGLGAAAELVDDGITGFTMATPGLLAGAVEAAAALDRRGVRLRAEERFSARRMALDYEAVYVGAAGGGGRGRAEDGPFPAAAGRGPTAGGPSRVGGGRGRPAGEASPAGAGGDRRRAAGGPSLAADGRGRAASGCSSAGVESSRATAGRGRP
jgi:glycosyltransferase involved in cell wall biosynthesis